MRATGAFFVSAVAAGLLAANAAPAQTVLPTGQRLTPQVARGAIFQPLNPDLPGLPAFTAGQASAVALSPDRKTLLILTSGFNRNNGPDGRPVEAFGHEYVFVYDVGGVAPVKRQVLQVPNTFLGIAWAPSGKRFYVSAGVDDAVLEYEASEHGFQARRSFPLSHTAGLGLEVKPETAGLAVSPDGRWLLAANLQNESVSLVDLTAGKVAAELDLRPGKIDRTQQGVPGGGYPLAVAWTSDNRAFVATERDREVIALSVQDGALKLLRRIRTEGQPTALVAGPGGRRLYASLDNTDAVAVIEPASGRVLEQAPTLATAPLLAGRRFRGGANSNALALSPDGRTLYVSNGGENAVAVVALRGSHSRVGLHVTGLIPTGWYPTGVAAAGGKLYVVNGKSDPGPNPLACRNTLSLKREDAIPCVASNSYVWQLEKAGFLALPTPTPAELAKLTRQVAANVGFTGGPGAAHDAQVMASLRSRIRHVIYIIKENRTYDQVLGDLQVGDGDPKLAVFPRAMTPNQHALASQFVDLDRFFASGESSNTGWDWTTAARTTDFTEREAPVNYAKRGLQYDQEGPNRNINVGIGDHAARVAASAAMPKDPDLLPGTADVAAPDGPEGQEGQGYLWDAALRAGLSVRNYGFFGALDRYEAKAPDRIPLERDPYAKKLPVFFSAKAALIPLTDVYFRGFDQAFPDFWRFQEWKREFEGYAAKGDLPALTLLRLPHDHTGRFAEGIDGVNTVEKELADNDYAVGLVVQTIAQSRFAKDTLIFIVEDDAQDGPDHISARRTTAYVAGPHVRQHAVVSRHYTTVNFVRTIEDVLGLSPLSLNDGLAPPMSEIFDLQQTAWSFRAQVPAVLRTTALPLPAQAAEAAAPNTAACRAPRTAAYWTKVMAGLDFDEEDHLDTARYNRALWIGMTGKTSYPRPTGADLSHDRPARLRTTACH